MEARKEIKIEEKKSNLILEDRKKLSISGVVEVISFNEEQILLSTVLGNLTVKGQELKMNKLDVQNGDVIISGKVNSCIYTSGQNKANKENIIAKLFK